MSALQLEGFLIPTCGVVSNFNHGDHKLVVFVRRGMGICHLVLYDLGIFQGPLDVQSLENFCAFFVVNFNRLSSFLQTLWLR